MGESLTSPQPLTISTLCSSSTASLSTILAASRTASICVISISGLAISGRSSDPPLATAFHGTQQGQITVPQWQFYGMDHGWQG